MSDFHTFTMVRHPLKQIWQVMRDHLPEVALSLDDLEGITLLERSHAEDGRLVLVNRWQAKQRIPALLQGRLGTDLIAWTDRACWDEQTQRCGWTITPTVLSEHIVCSGSTRYETAMAGRGTRVTFEGSFSLKPGFLSGLPSALEPAVRGLIEHIVSTVIPRNLARAVGAAGDYLGAGPESGVAAISLAGPHDGSPGVGR